MTRKRLFCAILALVLLISAQPAAMAASGGRPTTTITALPKMPTINVTVPTKGSVVINPLQLKVSIGGEDDDEQIVSSKLCLTNKSNVAVTVDITVTGSVKEGSSMKLASFPTYGSGTGKEAFIYFEIHPSDTDDVDLMKWDAEYDSTEHIVVMNNTSVIKKSVLTLAPKTLDGEVAPGGYAAFRLTGDAVREPDDPWKKADGVNVIVAFTFTPIPFEN